MAGSFNLSGRPSLHWHNTTTSPAPLWLVKKLLPQTGVVLLSGQWSSGKTFMALHLARCVWIGEPFAGQKIKRCGGTLLLAAEAAGDIPIRLRAIAEHSGSKKNDLMPFAWVDAVPKLSEPNAGKKLLDLAGEAEKAMQARFQLPLAMIVVDTMSAAAGFEDENSAAQAQPVMDALHELAMATNSLVLVIDHFGKSINAGTRGSNAKESSADAVLTLEVKRDARTMKVRKLRRGTTGQEFGYCLQPVALGLDEDGDEITTCIVKFAPQLVLATQTAGSVASASSTAPLPQQMNPGERRFKQALKVALDEDCRMLPFGPEGALVKATPKGLFRMKFYKEYPTQNTEARRRAFNRDIRAARDAGLICTRSVDGQDFVWSD